MRKPTASELFAVLLLTVLFGIAVLARAQEPTLLLIGHSFAHFQCLERQADFPGYQIECAYHDGQDCEQMLSELPADLAGLPEIPNFIIPWIGTNDAEKHVPPAAFAACASSYYRTLGSYYPQAKIVWPNVCPLAQVTLGLYGDTRTWVMGYNRIVYWTKPVDVWTLTAWPNGWANIGLIPSIHPSPAGWQVIDSALLQALGGRR